MSSRANVPFRRDEVEDYERRRYRGLDQRIVHDRETRILGGILRRIGPDVRRVLDVPCGYGRFSELHLGRGFRLTSSDLSFYMVRRTLEKTGRPGVHTGAAADLKRGLPFRADAFDAVFSMRFFHHVHNPEERRGILIEFGRVARRWAVVSFYKMNALHSLQRIVRQRLFRTKTRIKMVPFREFRREFEAAGFVLRGKRALLPGIHAQHILLLEKAKAGF